MEGQHLSAYKNLASYALNARIKLMQMALEKRSPQELSHYLREVADRIDLDFPVREPDHPPA